MSWTLPEIKLGYVVKDKYPSKDSVSLISDFENHNKLSVIYPDGRKVTLEDYAEDIQYTPLDPSFNVSNVKVALDELHSNKIDIIEKGQPDGIATLDSQGRVPYSQLPDAFKSTYTVDTYFDLPTEDLYDGMTVFVKDATGDPTVKHGWAIYRYMEHSEEWVKTSEGESLDLVVDWNDIQDKPETFPPSAHTQDWDTITDKPETFPPSEHNQSWETITDKPSTFPPSTHAHNYAGSSTPGGSATSALSCEGNSATATKLETSISLTISDSDGTNTGNVLTFDGSSDADLKLPSTIKANITGTASGNLAKTGGTLSGKLNGTDAEFTGDVEADSFTGSMDYGNLTNLPSTFPPSAHTQAWNTITDLPEEGFTPAEHTHEISDITRLQITLDGIDSALNGKASTSHTHNQSDINNLVSDLSTITGDISTINTTLTGKSDVGHTHNYAGSETAGGPATTALACTGNSATASRAEADGLGNNIANTYLSKSGGTLTGDLYGVDASFNGDVSATNGLLSSTKNNNTVTIGSSDYNYCYISNSSNIPFLFNKAIYASDKVCPLNDSMNSLGDSTHKWSNVYADAYNGGTLTLTSSATVNAITVSTSVTSASVVTSSLTVNGNATLNNLTANNNVNVTKDLTVSENATVTQSLTVNGTIINNGILKYGYTELTVAATLNVPVTKTLVIIKDPNTTPVPTYDCVLTVANGVLGQVLIVANMSSSEVHGSGVFVPSGESQKYVFLPKNNGENGWVSVSYGSIFYA